MAREPNIFDALDRYTEALARNEDERIRREQAWAERGRMETLARGIREETRADARAAQLEERIAQENQIMMQGKLQKEAREAAVNADQAQVDESRKIATQTFNVLDKRIANANKRLDALQEIDIKTRNHNARLVAQAVVTDKDTLDRLFNLGSATDNSLNLTKIPGKEKEAQFLYGEYAKLNQASLAPRLKEIEAITYERNRDMQHQGEIMRNVALTEAAVATGTEAPIPPLVVSDPYQAAKDFLGDGGRNPAAAPTNPGVGVVPWVYDRAKDYVGQATAIPWYAVKRAGAELFGTQRPELPYREDAPPTGNQVLSGPVAQPQLDMLPGAGAGQVFNAPGAPSGAEMQPGSFNTDGLQKLQQILEQTYGPDSMIPEEVFPTLVNMARASGWSEEKIQNAADQIHSGNIMGDGYQAALAFYRQYKAMSQGIPAPIQPGQSPGMQFRSGW